MLNWKELLFIRACKLYERGESTRAFHLFFKGASAGNSDCMMWVGVLYGDGVVNDPCSYKELWWYRKAWKKGNVSAPNNLAIVYKDRRMYTQAEYWFKVAIDNGDGDANLELAKFYISRNRAKVDVVRFLVAAVSARNITEQSVDEARHLLKRYT